jgi:drug/metabolite transporter (DMT)-like permease
MLAAMRARDVVELLLLSLLWGAAYLFTRAAVPDFGPAPLVALRLGMAAMMLLPIVLLRGHGPQLRAFWRPLGTLGVLYTAVPFLMISFAALHITAGLVAVLNATAPLFAALIARVFFQERLGAWRSAGLFIGFLGVLALMWGNTTFRSDMGLLAVAVMLVASMFWGFGGNHTRTQLGAVDPVAIAAGSLLCACVCTAPLALLMWPVNPPSARAWAEVAFLGFASSGVGFLIYFRLVQHIGPVRAMSVTFLNPVVTIVSGAWYLGETITLQIVLGGAVVLLGTALSLGLVRPSARPAAQAVEQQESKSS